MKIFIAAFLCAAILRGQAPGPLAALSPAASPPRAIGKTEGASASPAADPSTPAPATVASVRKVSDLSVNVDSSIVLEQPAGIRRLSIANAEIAEAVAVSSTQVLLNGKNPGNTSLIVWNAQGDRSNYQVYVQASTAKIDAVRSELLREAGPDVSVAVQDGTVFLRGTVKDTITADRAFLLASTLGKVVNLLRVLVPAAEPQIVLKVRFADVEREAALQLGINLFATNLSKGVGNITTGQFGASPTLPLSASGGATTTLTEFLNIFYYRPDLNLGAVIQALQAKNVLQILAEPNLLATSGRPASFLAGGEFPFPTLQGGGAGVGQITIQFKEFGIRLNFVPTVTPRGTIRLLVTPEVSSLDYGNGLTVNGFTVPGLDTRRIQTEVELADGQSFVIAGLLNNQVIENLNKIPGLSSIPLLGKLFESRNQQRNNTELLVMVTPEIVRPIPAGIPGPAISMPLPFMKGTAAVPPQTPGPKLTGPVPPLPRRETVPIEQLKLEELKNQQAPVLPAGPASGPGMLPPVMPPTTGPTNGGPPAPPQANY